MSTVAGSEPMVQPRSRPLLRVASFEALCVIAGQALGAFGAVFGVRVLTHALDPVAYGEVALGMTAATLGLQVLLGPLVTSALRYFAPAQEAGELAAFLSAVRSLLAWSLGAIIAVGAVVGGAAILSSGAHWLPLIGASIAYTLFSGTSSVLDGMQNAARQRLIVAWHDGLAPWLRFGAAVALIGWLSSPSSDVAMTGYALASLAVLISQAFFFRARWRRGGWSAKGVTEPMRARWRDEVVTYGTPFVLWGVFTWAQLSSDRWAIGSARLAEDLGIYAAIYQLGFVPMMLLSQVVVQVAAPVLFEKAGDASDHGRMSDTARSGWRVVTLVLGTTAVAVALAGLLHEPVAQLLLAREYRTASGYLPWLVLSGGLYATAQAVALQFLVRYETRALLRPKIVTALLAIAMNFAGARWFGLSGVIFAGIAFGLVYLLWLLILARATKRAVGAAS